MDTWVCTDCNNPQVIDAFQKQTLKSGKYLWRVQVRRGLVTVHVKEAWATAVIGFEFTPSDVKDVR
jgi:hypothetical protein